MRLRTRAAVLATAALLLSPHAPAHAAEPYAPLPPANPYAGPPGTATMHGDTGSSDATPLPGPGAGSIRSHRTALASACPTVLVGADGYPVALCTEIFGRAPTVHLLDPATGDPLAELTLTKGSLLGGVYAYLDHRDRLVVVDGDRDLLRVGHHRTTGGGWQLTVDSRLPLAGAVPEDDAVTGLSPDWRAGSGSPPATAWSAPPTTRAPARSAPWRCRPASGSPTPSPPLPRAPPWPPPTPPTCSPPARTAPPG